MSTIRSGAAAIAWYVRIHWNRLSTGHADSKNPRLSAPIATWPGTM
jgi:hypothetical protein